MDTNSDGRVNFKEFTLVLEKICRGDITHKMRLLYQMHLPPALLPEEIAELAKRESDRFDVVEAAGKGFSDLLFRRLKEDISVYCKTKLPERYSKRLQIVIVDAIVMDNTNNSRLF